MSLKFKPEDFCHPEWPYGYADLACSFAQAVFDKWLESQPVVYGAGTCAVWTSDHFSGQDTHTARLVCIESIKQKECEHQSTIFSIGDDGTTITAACKHCNAELTATWIVKK